MIQKGDHVVEVDCGPTKDMILCFSGGIDSLAAWHFLGKPQSIFFHYTNYSTIELTSALRLNKSVIIDESLSLAKFEKPSSAYILNRNLLFSCIASNYGSTVVIAGLRDDVVEDKTPQAFKAISEVLTLTTKRTINVVSPFWNMTKSDVVKWLLDNVPNAEHWLNISISCYAGETNCRMCPSCFRKACALWDNGIKTYFKNKPLMQFYLDKAMHWKYDKERCNSIIKFVKEHKEWRKDSGHIC